MSKMPSDHTYNPEDELLAEYRLDYKKAKPNRFATRNERQKVTVVVLDPDVAKVFSTSESVNQALRTLIDSMPQPASGETV
jgi:hypothetical protein